MARKVNMNIVPLLPKMETYDQSMIAKGTLTKTVVSETSGYLFFKDGSALP